MANEKERETDLRDYYRARVEHLSERLIGAAEQVISKEAIQRHFEFEKEVERRLQNGARFIAKRKSR